MKRIVTILLLMSLLLSTGLFAEGQQDNTAKKAAFEDGIYFAQEDQFSKSGWKYNVTLEVKDGEITQASWNGANINAGLDKVSLSKAGKYGMVGKGGASAPWFEQATAAEAYLLKTQNPSAVTYKDEEGHTDAFTGASIHVIEFFSLAEKALAAGPSGYGSYKDGSYHAEQPAFDHGYKYFVDVTVINGYVVAANWDALAEDGGKNKVQRSADGEYGMINNGGAMAPWFEQAQAVESHFLTSQDVNQPDAISGATIGLDPFYSLVQEALAGAKR